MNNDGEQISVLDNKKNLICSYKEKGDLRLSGLCSKLVRTHNQIVDEIYNNEI